MWLFVFFDLPVTLKTDRCNAARFRKDLEKDGFTMMQFSIYNRHCASRESMDVHVRRIRKLLPPRGLVSILSVTDKQFGDMINFWGKIERKNDHPPQQLELF